MHLHLSQENVSSPSSLSHLPVCFLLFCFYLVCPGEVVVHSFPLILSVVTAVIICLFSFFNLLSLTLIYFLNFEFHLITSSNLIVYLFHCIIYFFMWYILNYLFSFHVFDLIC